MKTKTKPKKVGRNVRYLPYVGIGFVVLMTLGGAAANVMPVHRPTAYELQQEEQAEIIELRRARIADMQKAGDRCIPSVARELARALVYDGRSARAYADDHERRCGLDPVVRSWGDVVLPNKASWRSGAAQVRK